MSLPEWVAAAALGSLIVYVVTGGADFGGGVWDLFATGPRAPAQRALIERALAPVWEANHVWLILLVVVLFTAFPRAYAAISTALHVPLTAMLIGVVFRGSAFVFRQYGAGGATADSRWGRVFAIASVATPVFLGVTVGAVTSGDLHFEGGMPTGGFFAPWAAPFPFAVGFFTLALFAYLAAVYLTVEAKDDALRDDFRARACLAQLALGITATVAALTACTASDGFSARLFGASWSWPVQGATALAAVGGLAALWRRRYRLARLFAILQAALIVAGWGGAQFPYLVRPDFTLASSAAPAATLELLLIALAAGSVLLIPSLYWLMRLFKSRP